MSGRSLSFNRRRAKPTRVARAMAAERSTRLGVLPREFAYGAHLTNGWHKSIGPSTLPSWAGRAYHFQVKDESSRGWHWVWAAEIDGEITMPVKFDLIAIRDRGFTTWFEKTPSGAQRVLFEVIR